MPEKTRTAILHYTAPPVVGGVEAVMAAHARVFQQHGHEVTIISGEGSEFALPAGTAFQHIPLMNSQHTRIRGMNRDLERGEVPDSFHTAVEDLKSSFTGLLEPFDHVFIHNIFTKHFNLPLTAALDALLDQGSIHNAVAWCHDFTWTSENSRHKVHNGFPWDLLRNQRPDVAYVTVSQDRQRDLAGLFDTPIENIHVVYNGVDPEELLGFSVEGLSLLRRIGFLESSLNLLMPVRITQAKNLEFALRTAAALRDLGCPNKLVITGPPDPHSPSNMAYFQSLKDLRHELNLEDRVFFVYEEGTESGEPYTISMEVIGDLYRASDALLMPSHREGFGMPVLEASLAGLPVFCSDIPAAREIGGDDMFWIDLDEGPEQAASTILSWTKQDKPARMRRRIRQNFTWEAIYKNDILPILGQ